MINDVKVLSALDEGLSDKNVCWHPLTIRADDGSVSYVRCGSKDERVCKSCAELFKGDTKRIIGSGIPDNSQGDYQFWFWTLTAPSFGRVHREGLRCYCGATHPTGSGWAGVAVSVESYDYAGQVEWNSGLGTLWNKSSTALREALPDAETASAREWQTRGVMHVHTIVRVPSWVSDEDVLAALKHAGQMKSRGRSWGVQQDSRRLGADDDVRHGVRYIAKALTYTVKSVAGGLPAVAAETARVEHFQRLDWAARAMRCGNPRCEKSHGASDHAPDRCCSGCPSLAHRRYGFAGHRFVKSRGWSFMDISRRSLAEERKAFAQKMTTSRATERATVRHAIDRAQHAHADAARLAQAWEVLNPPTR